MKMNKKLIVATAACAALLIGSISTSLAWLMDTTSAVTNTFTTSTIGVAITETTENYQMVPGWDIHKDPKVSVTENSQDAYLFVKIDESENFDTFMTYGIAGGWTALDGEEGVYYREVIGNQITEEYSVLAGDKVTVKESVTKKMMTATDFTQPTLTFTPYVHQLYKNAEKTEKIDVTTAWNNVKNETPANNP